MKVIWYKTLKFVWFCYNSKNLYDEISCEEGIQKKKEEEQWEKSVTSSYGSILLSYWWSFWCWMISDKRIQFVWLWFWWKIILRMELEALFVWQSIREREEIFSWIVFELLSDLSHLPCRYCFQIFLKRYWVYSKSASMYKI